MDDATVGDGLNGHVGRTKGGLFAKGNKLARGNPNAIRQYELRRQFLDAVNPEVIPALVRMLSVKALKGDLDATKILLDYVLGRPTQAVELSGSLATSAGPDWSTVEAAVLAAVEPLGDGARFRIAMALKEVADARPGPPGA